MIKRISISEFISIASDFPIFDVRSPGEFEHAHIPGAYSLPLFTNEERAIVGTAYKQKGKQPAIKIGLDFFGTKMNAIISNVEEVLQKNYPAQKKIIVHCWRGGMRSAGVAWLLDLYGFEVYTIVGGYKAYRTWAIELFNQDFSFQILGGYTGSGKTYVLQELEKLQQPVIDLEAIANHKGSAFGGIGLEPQPSQEMFENKLALKLHQTTVCFPEAPIWIEDESQRIGSLNIPNAIWKNARTQPVIFIEIPFSERLKHIVSDYGNLDVHSLISAVERIQKRFGPNETKITVQFLKDGDVENAFRILLNYYDKMYEKSLFNRENIALLLHKKTFDSVNPEIIAQSIIST